MYHVYVYRIHNGELLDSRSFEFGTWAEIGFYLDHYGYNEDTYRLEIRFSR